MNNILHFFIDIYDKEPVAVIAAGVATLSLLWQICSTIRDNRFKHKVHTIERKIYAYGVCSDIYDTQLKPVIRNIIKITPSSAELNKQSYFAAEKVYDHLFHLFSTMKQLEQIDKEDAERIRLFISNSILWSCHFIESIYDQCDPEKHKGHMFSLFRDCRSLEVPHYFSCSLPQKANTSTNYDIDMFT